MADESTRALRDEMNLWVSASVDRAWPSLQRALSRMARARWECNRSGARRRRWLISTTAHVLDPPQPTPLDLALGAAGACVHVQAQCARRGAIEGWTVSFRAFPDRDEVQITAATVQVSRDLSEKNLLALLRAAERDGPARYDLRLLPLARPPGIPRRLAPADERASGTPAAAPKQSGQPSRARYVGPPP